MRGSKRLRKKLVKQAGWDIVNCSRNEEGCHLELAGPDGEKVSVDAGTVPQVFSQALEKVRSGTSSGE